MDNSNVETSALEAWKKKIQIQLMSNKSFPLGASGQTGTAKVRFAIDRQGKLVSKELLESTGSDLLDAAAIGMVERVEPFPAPPAEVSDDKLSFTVPVVFAKGKKLPWAGGQWPADWVEEQKKVDAKIRGVCRGC